MATSKKGRRSAIKELYEQIDGFINQQGNNTFNYKQVAYALGAQSPQLLKAIAMRLAELEFDGELIEVTPGKYKIPKRGNVATGVFVRRSNGKNSVIIDGDDEAIFVAERNSKHALNGDKVKVIVSARIKGVEPEAQVLEIVESNDHVFIGALHVDNKHYGYLLTDSKFLATDII
ncbi:MAG: ribonuclease R, partial [Muribaculaceae bacterium]|nr:ribonuclease R [Muribaculaceae bacterium]